MINQEAGKQEGKQLGKVAKGQRGKLPSRQIINLQVSMRKSREAGKWASI